MGGERATDPDRNRVSDDRSPALVRELTRAEAAAEFETLADNIPTLCWMARADGHIYWYNRRWYEYTGTSIETQEGWGWESVHDPAVLPAVLERWNTSLASGSEFEMTFPLKGADGRFRPFLTRIVPIRDERGEITRWFGTNTDVDALKRTEAQLVQRTSELESLYGSAPIGLAFFDREYRYLRINDELASINGVAGAKHIGRTVREVLPDAPKVEPIIDRIFASGEPVRDLELSGETPQQPGVTRYWLAGFYPVLDDDDAVEAVGAWVIEISDRKAAEQRENLLAREVDHRAKNLLAVVQSVVQLTKADSKEELKSSIIGRIQSLARAHSLLADSRWDGVQLMNLVQDELAPFEQDGEARASFDGPAMMLRPAAAQSLAIVLHELATNAAKYGALSRPCGRLNVKWNVDEEALRLTWEERGGPPQPQPGASGFGSKIIRASIERQLRGRVDYQWRDEGLFCTLEVPLPQVGAVVAD